MSDVGRYRIVEARAGESHLRLLLREGEEIQLGPAQLAFDRAHTRLYADQWLADGGPAAAEG